MCPKHSQASLTLYAAAYNDCQQLGFSRRLCFHRAEMTVQAVLDGFGEDQAVTVLSTEEGFSYAPCFFRTRKLCWRQVKTHQNGTSRGLLGS